MSRDRHTAAGSAVRATAAKPEKVKGLRITEATKLYKSHLAAVLVKKPGDGNFPAAELCWRRLVRDYPVDLEDRRKLVACAFEGAAAQEVERVSALHLDRDDTGLWALMRDRLYNPAQVQAVRSRFASAKWSPGRLSRSLLLDFARWPVVCRRPSVKTRCCNGSETDCRGS
jgi:hypothetical protein